MQGNLLVSSATKYSSVEEKTSRKNNPKPKVEIHRAKWHRKKVTRMMSPDIRRTPRANSLPTIMRGSAVGDQLSLATRENNNEYDNLLQS